MSLESTIRMMAEKKVVKEDGHTDVASAKRQCKTAMEDAQAIIGVLDGMNDEDALPTWWTNKLAIAANSMNKLNDYLSNPTEQIKEGTWQLPKTPIQKAQLKKLMSKPIILGKDGEDALDKLGSLIGDDELFDDLAVAGKKNPKGDARDVIKKHMKRLGLKEEVEIDESSDIKGEISQLQKMLKGLERGKKTPGKGFAKMKIKELIADLEKRQTQEEVELDEAASARVSHKGFGYELHHKDFASAMQHAYKMAKKNYGITVDPKEIDDKVALGPRKPSKGKTNSYRLLDKDGKRAIQVQVYGMPNGKYELNMYKESVELDREEILDKLVAEAQEMGMYDTDNLDNLIEEALNEEVKYPHMMYDPETGEGVEVKTPEEHDKYAEKGYTHEKPELDEMKEPFVVIDTADGNKVVGTASDEKGAKSIISTSQLPPMKIKDKKTLKIVKVKKKQMIGQPLKEETVNEHTHYKMETMGVSRSLVDSVRSVLAGKPQEEALDKVDPKAVKKKFDDRKDKDIDNDGDVDDSDEYLHKRRQAISKAIKGEEKDDKKKDKKDEKNGKKEPIEIDPEIKEDTVKEQEMTDAQMKRREEIVKELKKKEDEFKDRYGDRWKEVMYATATKMAMKEAKK